GEQATSSLQQAQTRIKLNHSLLTAARVHQLPQLLQSALQKSTDGQRAAVQVLRNLGNRPIMEMLQNDGGSLVVGQRGQCSGKPLRLLAADNALAGRCLIAGEEFIETHGGIFDLLGERSLPANVAF